LELNLDNIDRKSTPRRSSISVIDSIDRIRTPVAEMTCIIQQYCIMYALLAQALVSIQNIFTIPKYVCYTIRIHG